ncbi:MAG: coenzyme F420-0:L-glutamate ligase [Bacilli bacterium]|jgi:F420-0:gamma-glutamyl ligase|nr:coenzyme F420-0:L-glutamate ligase [Bacilli bacterium]
MRMVGTTSRGIRTPIIKEGDNLANIVVDSVIKASKNEEFKIHDKDIICVTEAVVGISEGNYCTVDDIANDIRDKYVNGEVGVVYPILSRNRFSLILKGIARGAKKIVMLLSFPSDEVGNGILDENRLSSSPFNLSSIITENDYNEYFGDFIHPFTGINMVSFYRDLVKSEDCEIEFVFSNNPLDILKYTPYVLNCDIHTREHTKELFSKTGALCYSLTDIMNKSNNGSGYNPKYGLLGSNKSTEERLKLFPKDGEKLILDIQKKMKELTGKDLEVMVYGDGAFKDPVGHIWELADPVVSPFYTSGLEGTPNEIKLKYVSDNKLADLRGEDLIDAMKKEIRSKDNNLVGKMVTQGTTPRRITDLVGSLADLTSGSGDKGTPVVLIQGYFDNYANE